MTPADAMIAALIAAGQDRSLAVRFGSLDGAMLTVIAGRVPGGDGMAISVDLREFAPGDAGRILDDSDVAECYPASRGERKPSAGWTAPDGRSIDRDEAFVRSYMEDVASAQTQCLQA